MALRFRKSIRVAPGLSININKKSVSARVGPKHVGMTAGTKGAHVSAGLPGTGLYVSKKISGARRTERPSAEEAAGAADDVQEVGQTAMGRAGTAVFRGLAGLFVLVLAISLIGLLV